MAHVEDRWTTRVDGKKIPNERHGTGLRWRARHIDPTGRERSKSFAIKDDANQWLASEEVRKMRGIWLDPTSAKETFGSYARRRMHVMVLAPASVRRYESDLTNHLYPSLEFLALGAITPTDVRAVVKQLTVAGKAKSTIKSVHGLLAGIMASAVDDGLIAKSPCSRVTSPRKPKRPKLVILTVEQVHAVAAAMPARFRPAVWLGAGCGMRVGEVLGLRLHRVRFLDREIDIASQLQLLPGSPPVERPPKFDSVRTVALPDVVGQSLAVFLAQWPQPDPKGYVLRGRGELPVWPNSFNEQVWRLAVIKAKLPEGTRFHSLRHFYASALIQAGESVKSVQDALGHRSAVETLETYAGLWPESQTRARAAIDGLLGISHGPQTAQQRRKGH